jgi:hypothetical protein
MPTLDLLINEKKLGKKKTINEKKEAINESKTDTKMSVKMNEANKKQLSTIEMLENRIKNEDNKKKNFEASSQVSYRFNNRNDLIIKNQIKLL